VTGLHRKPGRDRSRVRDTLQRGLATAFSVTGGAALLGLLGITVTEVVARHLVGVSLLGAEDLVTMSLTVLVAAAVGAVVWFTGLYALAPAVAWLLWRRRLSLVRYAAPAWCALLLVLPAQRFADAASAAPPPQHSDPMEVAAGSGGGGFVYAQTYYSYPYGGLGPCPWGDPWADAGDLRPLTGLYRETSASAEFIDAEEALRLGRPADFAPPMDDWAHAWDDAPIVEPDSRAAAEALGARWLVTCDPEGLSAAELHGRRAGAAGVAVSLDEHAWHEQATRWWAGLLAGRSTLSEAEQAVPSTGEADWEAYPPESAATGVELLEAGESFAVTAATAGWVWVRIPWDPYWHAHNATPVLKGGPGHLIVWAEPGQNSYGWWIPRGVDTAGIIVTAAAAAGTLILVVSGRRPRGQHTLYRRGTGPIAIRPLRTWRVDVGRRGTFGRLNL